MKLQDYIEQTLECFDGYGEKVIIFFDLLIDEKLEVNDIGPHKIKFEVINR